MIKVKKSEENPESTEILAKAIVDISKAFNKLYDGGLNEDAIIILIQDSTKLPKRDIRLVLDSLRRLESWYCRK